MSIDSELRRLAQEAARRVQDRAAGLHREYLEVQRHLTELKSNSNATISRRIAFQTFSLRSRLTISARPAGSRIKPDHLCSQFQARAEGKFLNADWVTFLKWPTRRSARGFFSTPRDGQTSLLGLGAFLSFPCNL